MQHLGVVSRFVSNPEKPHWEAVKWILRYLKGTSDYALCFGGNNVQLQGFTDSDFGGDLDKQRSTTRYVFMFVGASISWVSRLQHFFALSSTEAKYIALSEGVREMLWLQRLFSDLRCQQSDYVLFVIVATPFLWLTIIHLSIVLNILAYMLISFIMWLKRACYKLQKLTQRSIWWIS